MQFEQRDGISFINVDIALTQQTIMELCNNIQSLAMQAPHKIIINMQQMPYITTSALLSFFQSYSALFEKGFSLEIQAVNKDSYDLLKLANFHLLADINKQI